jgi:hypothetical protein
MDITKEELGKLLNEDITMVIQNSTSPKHLQNDARVFYFKKDVPHMCNITVKEILKLQEK